MTDATTFDIPDKGIVLFHTARSYCAQQVRLALAEKALDWDSRYLELGKSEHFHPRYARMNPHLVVPTLVHNGRIVCDAVNIIHYLDEIEPKPALSPAAPEMKKRMEYWIDLEDKYPVKYLSIANLPDDLRLRQLQGWQARLNALEQLLVEYRADPELAEIYRKKIAEISEWKTVEADKAELTRITTRMDRMLDQVEDQVRETEFLAGDQYSLADLAWTPVLYRIEECDLTGFWSGGRRPHLERYYQSIKHRPSFRPAILDFLEGRRR